MGKKLMRGKNIKSIGKKMSHGNSHATSKQVMWDESKREWILLGKK